MKLIDDDVVELFRIETIQVFSSAESLNRSKQHLRVRLSRRAVIKPEPRQWTNLTESVQSLREDLFAMGDKKNARELSAVRVERTEPSLAETRRENDETCSISSASIRFECLECGLLNFVRFTALRGLGRLLIHRACARRHTDSASF